MTAATSPRASRASTASRSFQGSTSVCSMAAGSWPADEVRRRWSPPGATFGPAGQADEHAVEPAVVVALELDDRVAAGRAAGDPERQLDGLAAGVGEADHLGARARSRSPGGRRRTRRRVSPPSWTPRASWRVTASMTTGASWPRMIGPAPQVVVDQAVAVDVEEQRALGAVQDERRRRRAGSRCDAPPGSHCEPSAISRRGLVEGEVRDRGLGHRGLPRSVQAPGMRSRRAAVPPMSAASWAGSRNVL